VVLGGAVAALVIGARSWLRAPAAEVGLAGAA
jgi:hypothetical protein